MGDNGRGSKPRREGGGVGGGRSGQARARGGGEEPEALRQAAVLVETANSWVAKGSAAGAVDAMEALCRVGRREVQGGVLDAVKAMITNGCKAIASPDLASCRTPAETRVFLRAVQRMLYQEALTLEASARQDAVERLLSLLTSTHKAVQARGQSPVAAAGVDTAALEQLQLLLELSRTVGCFVYEAPTVSGEILTPLVTALQPLLEFPRDLPTSSSANVAATLLQKEQQQQQPQLLLARHTRVLASACSADALANATAGLGRAAETLATDIIPQFTINLHAWSALLTGRNSEKSAL